MITVLGLGNVLMGDDGFGPTVVRLFESTFDVGNDVDVLDLGTPGLDLTPWLFDADDVVIVDTVKSDAPAGTLRVYDEQEMLCHAPGVRVGPHDPGVKEALLTLKFAGHGPRSVTVIGVVPERIIMDTELSAAVRSAIPRTIDTLRRGVEGRGARLEPREKPRPAAPWWSAPASPGSDRATLGDR